MKVSISDLNIRKGPGADYDRIQFIPIGVYTIMEGRGGKCSSAGWGRLEPAEARNIIRRNAEETLKIYGGLA